MSKYLIVSCIILVTILIFYIIKIIIKSKNISIEYFGLNKMLNQLNNKKDYTSIKLETIKENTAPILKILLVYKVIKRILKIKSRFFS